jgi:hypothetical protein
MASAFCLCASAEFLDRDSAATVTNARSGATMMTASPFVTTTGIDGAGSCADVRGVKEKISAAMVRKAILCIRLS